MIDREGGKNRFMMVGDADRITEHPHMNVGEISGKIRTSPESEPAGEDLEAPQSW